MASSKMPIEKKKCITPPFRASFPNVFEPKSFEGQEPKFSIAMLFEKNADLKAMRQCVMNAAVEKWGADKAKWPKGLRMPFRDGDEKSDLQGYAGKILATASSKNRPQVIDRDKSPIDAASGAFYAGCYARASVIAFAYDKAGNKGVSFSLGNLQKTGDGEQFSGRKNATDEFDEVEDGSESAENYKDAEEAEADEYEID